MNLKISVFFLLGLSLLIVPAAHSASIGSPLNIPMDIMEEERLSIAADGNFITGKDLETKDGITNEIDESTQIGLKIAYGLAEGVSLYAKIGMADWSITRNIPETIDYENAPYYGAGIAYAYKAESNIIIGGDIQYIMQSDVGVDTLTYAGRSATNIGGMDADFSELQISVLCGYDIAVSDDTHIVPYAGLGYDKFSYEWAAGSLNTTSTIDIAAGSLDGDNALGLIAGTSVSVGSNLNIHLEGRFVSETAFSLGFNYRF
ncbi:MAG: hypothetical protein PHO30_01590 [Candidatus Omnitrophica bacterium]|nr:hypothetical protein [Candidatus Omnitrophota bacterium]